MRWVTVLRRRIRAIVFRSRQEDELEREIELHIEQLARTFMSGGMTREEAVGAARREFGPVERMKEECRDERRVRVVEDLARDARFALRMFRKSPGFTLTALTSLVLGIGANTAMFQMFDAVRLRSLPVSKPEELVALHVKGERAGNFRGRNGEFSYALWDEIRRRQQSFSGVIGYGDTPLNLSPAGEIRNAEGLRVSGNFFNLLGVTPQLGRVFGDTDDKPGCAWEGAVISHAFWQREFGGREDVLSQSVSLDGHRVPIIGVTRPGFLGIEVGRSFDVAVPICTARPEDLASRTFNFVSIMGRLREGVSEAAARQEMMALSQSIFAATVPDTYRPDARAGYEKLLLTTVAGGTGQSEFRDSFSQPLAYLLAMVALVLLLACANLANMMLARATSREHEFAVRRSMGATGRRLIQQVLVESLILSTAGAVIGSLAAPALGRALVSMLSTPRDPLVVTFDPSNRVFLFAAAVATIATLLFGLAPAVRASRASTRGASEGRGTLAFRRFLLGAQVAFSMILVTSAFLFARSFQNLQTSSPGFDANGILVAHVFLDGERYAPSSRPAVIESLFSQVRALPGVESAARSSIIPMGGSSWGRDVQREGSEDKINALMSAISPGYLHTLKMPLIAGRDFNPSDTLDSTPVTIVNESLARKLFNQENPIGRTVRFTGSESLSPPTVIVGLMKDSKYETLSETPYPIVYVADMQTTPRDTRVRMVIRASSSLAPIAKAVQRVVGTFDPRLNLRLVVLQDQLAESILRERLLAALTGTFGILGMVLALTGVFGVTAYVVSRRYREFGIRMAMGADGKAILRLILGEIAVIVVAGIAVGGLVAIGAGGSASALLYGVKAYDVSILLAVTLLLALGGLVAGWIPARRAARVDPVDVLRLE